MRRTEEGRNGAHEKPLGNLIPKGFGRQWAALDSNQRLPPCEDGTLTAELAALELAKAHRWRSDNPPRHSSELPGTGQDEPSNANRLAAWRWRLES